MNFPSFSFFICGVDSKVSFVNKLHHGKRNTLYRLFHAKGGAGKTTLTVLVASYLHYVKGMNVAVVDCDYPQHSIAEMRKRDLKTVMEDEHYKLMAYRQLQRIRKKAYPVAESTAEDAVTKADELLEKMPETDIVFFDLPGTVNSTGVLNTLANMDYVFSPIAADRVVMESTLRFASRLNDTLIATGKTNIKGLYLLWNMVDGREKSELYKVYEQVIGELGLKVLKTFLPDSKRFRRELTGNIGHCSVPRCSPQTYAGQRQQPERDYGRTVVHYQEVGYGKRTEKNKPDGH